MWYEVSYILRTHDDDGPETERRRFSAPDGELADEMGRAIARSRAEGINHRGGAAAVNSITVKRVRKPGVKRPR
jgi:hypothetical protein